LQAETSRLAQDLKSAIEKKDKDLVRLREQRDQQSAELNERKQREAFKQSSFDEIKTLAETRSVS
jgi:E3 ubiquitin-protein ligase BRE1